MKIKMIFNLLIVLLLSSCNNNASSSETLAEAEQYKNGTYCAEVNYYNPKTQRTSNYSLNVEIMHGKLVKIKWSNGGWLDERNFTAPTVSENGICSFTSNKGYSYKIYIRGAECSYTDNPEDIDGSILYFSRRECADDFNASAELFNRYLKERKVSADDIISEKQCDMMHEHFEILSRLMNLEKRINEGYIQNLYSKKGGFGGSCQTIVVKRHGSYYVLEITNGEATMGLTSFDPNITDWQRIMIQENPKEEKWVVVIAKVIASGSRNEMEGLSESICK